MYIFVYSLFCPGGISEGFLLALRISMLVCVYIHVFSAELAVQNAVDFFVSTYHEMTSSTIGGGRGCNKFVPVLVGNGTKMASTGDIFDQPPGQM